MLGAEGLEDCALDGAGVRLRFVRKWLNVRKLVGTLKVAVCMDDVDTRYDACFAFERRQRDVCRLDGGQGEAGLCLGGLLAQGKGEAGQS